MNIIPRRARKQSRSGIYHIMLRGINRQQIFHDETDYKTFLDSLIKCRETGGFSLYAYCLMPNHVHLLLRENLDGEGEALEKIMRRLGTRFVYRYNLRYQRSGPLFDGRYKSEAVEDDAYFLTVLRYIHRNPVKVGICNAPSQYKHSSFSAYLWPMTSRLLETDTALSLLQGLNFEAWHELEDEAKCLDMEQAGSRAKASDEQVLKAMRKACGAGNLEEFCSLPQDIKEKAIRKMRQAGASWNQLVRLSGMSMAMVRKAAARQ